MKEIIIKITGPHAQLEHTPVITSGMVGLPVRFQFDESWAGFTKTAVFTAGGVSRDVLEITDGCAVPFEVLMIPYRTLRIGVYGVSADGKCVMPTVWADAGQILPGAEPAQDGSAEPSLPVWQQLLQKFADYYTREETDRLGQAWIGNLISQHHMEEYVAQQIGDISTALDELHAYAEALKGGESV